MPYPRESISFHAVLPDGAISTDYDADPWFKGGDIPDEFTSAFYVMIMSMYSEFHRLRLRLNTRGRTPHAAVYRCKARRNWGRK